MKQLDYFYRIPFLGVVAANTVVAFCCTNCWYFQKIPYLEPCSIVVSENWHTHVYQRGEWEGWGTECRVIRITQFTTT